MPELKVMVSVPDRCLEVSDHGVDAAARSRARQVLRHDDGARRLQRLQRRRRLARPSVTRWTVGSKYDHLKRGSSTFLVELAAQGGFQPAAPAENRLWTVINQ